MILQIGHWSGLKYLCAILSYKEENEKEKNYEKTGKEEHQDEMFFLILN